MNKNKLQELVAKELYESFTGLPWPNESFHVRERTYQHADRIIETIKEFISNSKDIDPEIMKFINEKFWDLV